MRENFPASFETLQGGGRVGPRFFERFAPTLTAARIESEKVLENGVKYARSCSLMILPSRVRCAIKECGGTDCIFYTRNNLGEITWNKSAPPKFLRSFLK